MYVLTRVFCVLLYARVSLSISFGFHLLDLGLLEIIFYLVVIYFHSVFLCQLCIRDICIWDFYCTCFRTVFVFRLCILYLFLRLCIIVASWTTIYFIFRCELFWYSMSVIGFICSKFYYNLLFCIIQVWHVWIIVDLNGPK